MNIFEAKVTSFMATFLKPLLCLADGVPAAQGLLQEINCNLREFEWPDRWFFENDRRLVKDDEKVWCIICLCMCSSTQSRRALTLAGTAYAVKEVTQSSNWEVPVSLSREGLCVSRMRNWSACMSCLHQ